MKRNNQHHNIVPTTTSTGNSDRGLLVVDQGQKKQKIQGDHDENKLGVSVHHLQTQFMDKVYQTSGLNKHSKIYQIENLDNEEPGIIRKRGLHVVSPTDAKIGAAYVHCLEGADNVGMANFMLSYTWDYTIGEVIDTLVSHCNSNNLDPKRTYIWICCLCVNQHRVVEQKRSGALVPTTVFLKEFQKRVVEIGHVLVMMAPWKKPKYLTRIWCIFELYVAHQHREKCQVTIVMPPQQEQQLEYDLLSKEDGDIETLYKTLAITKIEDAEATVEDDRVAILDMVRGNSGPGYRGLNNQVNELLRCWVLSSIRKAVRNRLENDSSAVVGREEKLSQSFFCKQVGRLLIQNDEHDEALVMFRKALTIDESLLGVNHPNIATSYNSIGRVLRYRGNHDEALVMHYEACSIYECSLGTNHQNTAASYNYCGEVLYDKGNYDAALVMHRKALALHESILGVNHQDTATSYKNIGEVLYAIGKYDKAFIVYRKALAINELVLGVNHRDTASLYNNIALVLNTKGNYDEALVMLYKALAVYESLLGINHQDSATSYNNIALVLNVKGDYDKALVMFRKALAVYETVLGVNHQNTATSYNNIGSVLQSKGNCDEALVMYRKACAINESVLGLNHKNTASFYNNIGELLHDKGKHDEALVVHGKALAIRQTVLSANHQDTATSYNNIGEVLRVKGNYDAALFMYSKAMAIFEVELGTNHPSTLIVKRNAESCVEMQNA